MTMATSQERAGNRIFFNAEMFVRRLQTPLKQFTMSMTNRSTRITAFLHIHGGSFNTPIRRPASVRMSLPFLKKLIYVLAPSVLWRPKR